MKLFAKKAEKKTEQEKVEERREKILATGRKFKYPLQWTKHRVIINTILISFIVLAIIFMSGWLALYRLNMTDDLLFRITKILPVSVAQVDSENVRFSDYLMFYRSSIISIERQSGQVDNQGSVALLENQYKRAALLEAEKYTYTIKLAKEFGITVSDEEIQTEFERHLKIGGVDRSEEAFMKIIEENFGLSKDEYERMLYLTIMKAKVEMEIDTIANQTADKVEVLLRQNNNYQAVSNTLGQAVVYEETGGMVSSQNIDGGRASEAFKLEPGQSSGRFVSINGDGYYFVKLISKTDAAVNFVSIKVPFTEFDKRFESLSEESKITEYINLPVLDAEE